MEGIFLTGKSKDGSDAKVVRGAYINPNNKDEWSSKPYPGKQKQDANMEDELMDYMNGRFTLREVYEQIQRKECPLPSRIRKFVCELM